jgi:hypothetical protein
MKLLLVLSLLASSLVYAQADNIVMEFKHPDPDQRFSDCATIAMILNATKASRPGDFAVLTATCHESKLTVSSAGLKPARRANFDLVFMKSDLSCQDTQSLISAVSSLRSSYGTISGSVDCDYAIATRRLSIRVVRLR